MLKATVSGSFHRHMTAIYAAVGELRVSGVDVLSPSDPRVVDHIGDFLFVASDRLRSIKLVENRHLEAILASDFLWIVCPDGYTGASTSMEIGAAIAARIPVFASVSPLDVTISQYVERVRNHEEAINRVRSPRRAHRAPTFLLDPHGATERAISSLADLRSSLLGYKGNGRDDAERTVRDTASDLKETFGLN